MNQQELLLLLNKYHLRPDKKLGQHFLLDQSVLDATIAAAQITEGELVIEVGAGPGILTSRLAQAGADVLAVEFDRDFCRLLQEEYHNWRNVHVLGDDALRLNWAELVREGKQYKKVVANIPYQITNPLVRQILEPTNPVTVAVLLVQKEVAERLMAPAGSSDRGILTIMVEYMGKIERVVDVPPTAFWPAPKVDSMVIKITKDHARAKRLNLNEKAFFWFVKQSFSGKRKILLNSMMGGLHLSKAEAGELVASSGIKPELRAEDLTFDQWLKLFGCYEKLVN